MSILSDLVKMYELWGTWKDKQISEPEEELVITALEANGQLFVFETSLDGEFVSIGTRYYLDERDPAVRARYLEALEKCFAERFVAVDPRSARVRIHLRARPPRLLRASRQRVYRRTAGARWPARI